MCDSSTLVVVSTCNNPPIVLGDVDYLIRRPPKSYSSCQWSFDYGLIKSSVDPLLWVAEKLVTHRIWHFPYEEEYALTLREDLQHEHSSVVSYVFANVLVTKKLLITNCTILFLFFSQWWVDHQSSCGESPHDLR